MLNPDLTDDAIAQLYVMKFSVISLYLTKLYVTLSFAIASSLTDNEIRQIFSSSVPRLRDVRPAGWVTCYSTVYARVQCREPKRFNSQVRQNTLSIWVHYLTTVCSSYTGRTACTAEYLTLWLEDSQSKSCFEKKKNIFGMIYTQYTQKLH